MTARTPLHGLKVDTALAHFIDEQVLPGTGVTPANFWRGFDAIVHDLAPKNAALLAERDRLQAELSAVDDRLAKLKANYMERTHIWGIRDERFRHEISKEYA